MPMQSPALTNLSDMGPVETDNALASLGPDIRELRKSRHLTVRQLALAIGRSPGFISLIERNQSRPSLKDLYAISAALGVHVGWFLERPDAGPENEQGKIVRRANRRWMENEGIRTESLSPQLGQGVEFMMATFQPGAKTEPTTMPKPGCEAALVVSGRLDMWIDGELFQLNAGDSYLVRFEQRYYSRNPSETAETILVWTTSYT